MIKFVKRIFLECNECGEEQLSEAATFEEAIKEMEAQGWEHSKDKDGSKDYLICYSCKREGKNADQKFSDKNSNQEAKRRKNHKDR
jgi:hypothetical protein